MDSQILAQLINRQNSLQGQGSEFLPTATEPNQASGSTGIPAPVDIRAELARIMQPQAQQEPGTVQSILQALASGVATGLSNDPGAALIQQIQGIEQKKKQQQDRQDQMRMIEQQFQLNDLNSRITEERQIRLEKRQQASQVEAEGRAEKADIRKGDRTFNQQAQLEDIRNDYRMEELKFNKDGQMELEKARSSNNIAERRFAALYDTAAPLVFSGLVNEDQAAAIFKELDETGKLTGKNATTLAKANKMLRDEKFKQERALRAASASGGSGGDFQNVMTKLFINEALNSNYYEDDKGMIQQAQKDLTGQLMAVPGTKIARWLNPAERAAYGGSLAANFGKGMKVQGPTVTGNQDDMVRGNLKNLIDIEVKAGRSKAEIMQGLADFKQKNPQFSAIADSMSASIPETKEAPISKESKQNREGMKQIGKALKDFVTPKAGIDTELRGIK